MARGQITCWKVAPMFDVFCKDQSTTVIAYTKDRTITEMKK